MDFSGKTMENEESLSTTKMLNSRHVIISVIIYLVMTQFAHVLISSRYLKEYLVSHTIVFILVAVAIYYISLVYKPGPFVAANLGRIFLYSLCGIMLCAIINFPYSVFELHVKPKEYVTFINYGAVARLYFLIMLCVVGPIVEEIYCRFYIYNMVKDDFNITIAVIVSSFLYMILHGLRIDLIYGFIPGVIYALVYEKSKTIWSSVVVHGLNNLIWFSLVCYA